MLAWRVSRERRATDLSGTGAALEGGRWNEQDVPAVYMGLSPAICCLETFVHTTRRPTFALKITCFELPDDEALYFEPDVSELPDGWNAVPADTPSMLYGTAWLRSPSHLGLVVPSSVLPLERNLVVNPAHPGIGEVRVRASYDFLYDDRMFTHRTR